MKKTISFILALVLAIGCMAFSVSAETTGADVFITFSDSTGKIVLAQEKITVTDKNNDGKYDIDEALFALHEAKFEGGAAAGYAIADGSWGPYITKLWGDTSGNFGYYVNSQMAMGLTDEVKAGDYLDAFVYQIYEYNPTTYETTADTYTFFDRRTANVTEGDSITLVLKDVEFDVNYSPVNAAIANAVILIDGKETAYKTDADGKVTFPIEKAGEILVSAKKDGAVLVPPVLKVTAAAKPAPVSTPVKTQGKPKSEKTGDATGMIFALLALSGLTAVFAGKKLYEV